MNDMESRTRPAGRPSPDVAALRALRKATRDYLLVLEAGYQALGNDVIEKSPDLGYLRSELAVTTGTRGSGGFGTVISIERRLTQLLGEAEP